MIEATHDIDPAAHLFLYKHILHVGLPAYLTKVRIRLVLRPRDDEDPKEDTRMQIFLFIEERLARAYLS